MKLELSVTYNGTNISDCCSESDEWLLFTMLRYFVQLMALISAHELMLSVVTYCLLSNSWLSIFIQWLLLQKTVLTRI